MTHESVEENKRVRVVPAVGAPVAPSVSLYQHRQAHRVDDDKTTAGKFPLHMEYERFVENQIGLVAVDEDLQAVEALSGMQHCREHHRERDVRRRPGHQSLLKQQMYASLLCALGAKSTGKRRKRSGKDATTNIKSYRLDESRTSLETVRLPPTPARRGVESPQ